MISPCRGCVSVAIPDDVDLLLLLLLPFSFPPCLWVFRSCRPILVGLFGRHVVVRDLFLGSSVHHLVSLCAAAVQIFQYVDWQVLFPLWQPSTPAPPLWISMYEVVFLTSGSLHVCVVCCLACCFPLCVFPSRRLWKWFLTVMSSR
eukprot:NODE_754_length_805_cov_1306.826720_g496_i0.p1 GENE.NODE_754_length_805_cov_1306.826720_g496_i0~~NODE_754_length_805_cov_1306.826720_g496_i0.p1  ORF type:complete len:146 (+),score=31.53 NODE_754_length_805_cov_1306.826720_g496_i0:260-697(+)